MCVHCWPHLPLTEVTGGGGDMGCGLQSLLIIGINIFPDTQTPNSSPQTQIAGSHFFFFFWSFLPFVVPLSLGVKNAEVLPKKEDGGGLLVPFLLFRPYRGLT